MTRCARRPNRRASARRADPRGPPWHAPPSTSSRIRCTPTASCRPPRWWRTPRRGGRRAARALRPRHGRRGGRGARRGRRSTACASCPPPRSRPSTAPTRTCTCSATGSTTAARCSSERLLDARADRERRADAMAARLRRARLRGRPGADRGAQGRRQAGGAAAPGRGGARPSRQRRAARRGGPRGRLLLHPRLPDPGHAGLRGAHAPDRRGGDRLDPRRRRRGRLGASVLGHQGRATRCSPRSTATAPPGSTGSRCSTRPTPRSRRCCSPTAAPSSACSRTGSSDYHGPDHRLFSRFRAFELHGREPNLGPIAHGTLAAPARGGAGLCIWLTGLSGSGKSTVGRLAAGELRDRGHRVEVLDGDDVRQNLCAGLGFSREDRDMNVRRIAFVADLLSRNGVVTFVAAVSPYRRRARRGARADGRALRGGVRARVGRGVRAPRREGPLRARPRRARSRASPASPTPTRSRSRPS